MFNQAMIIFLVVVVGIAIVILLVIDFRKLRNKKHKKEAYIHNTYKLLVDIKIIHNRVKGQTERKFIGIDSNHELTPTLDNARFLLELKDERCQELFTLISHYYAEHNIWPNQSLKREDQTQAQVKSQNDETYIEITKAKNQIIYGGYNIIDHLDEYM